MIKFSENELSIILEMCDHQLEKDLEELALVREAIRESVKPIPYDSMSAYEHKIDLLTMRSRTITKLLTAILPKK